MNPSYARGLQPRSPAAPQPEKPPRPPDPPWKRFDTPGPDLSPPMPHERVIGGRIIAAGKPSGGLPRWHSRPTAEDTRPPMTIGPARPLRECLADQIAGCPSSPWQPAASPVLTEIRRLHMLGLSKLAEQLEKSTGESEKDVEIRGLFALKRIYRSKRLGHDVDVLALLRRHTCGDCGLAGLASPDLVTDEHRFCPYLVRDVSISSALSIERQEGRVWSRFPADNKLVDVVSVLDHGNTLTLLALDTERIGNLA